MNELDSILLEAHNKHIKGSRNSLDWRLKYVKEGYLTLKGLKDLGLYTGELNYSAAYFCTDIQVSAADLPRLRTIFETAKDSGKRTVHSRIDNTVKVYLNLGYDNQFVYYIKELEEDSKCKITLVDESSYQLICKFD